MDILRLYAFGSGVCHTFSLYTEKLINRPLRRLYDAFQELRKGNMEVRISHSSKDEFEYIYEGFNHMVQELQRMIEEVYEQKNLADRYSGWKASWITLEKLGGQLAAILKEMDALKTGVITDDMTESMVENYQKMQAFVTAKEDKTLSALLASGDAGIRDGIGRYTVCSPTGGGAVMLEQIERDLFHYSAYNTAPTEKMASCYSTLNKMAHETIIKIICGEDVDSYNDFLDAWKALGGTDVTREAQEWYDETIAGHR